MSPAAKIAAGLRALDPKIIEEVEKARWAASKQDYRSWLNANYARWGLPAPDDVEFGKIVALGILDEKAGRQ